MRRVRPSPLVSWIFPKHKCTAKSAPLTPPPLSFGGQARPSPGGGEGVLTEAPLRGRARRRPDRGADRASEVVAVPELHARIVRAVVGGRAIDDQAAGIDRNRNRLVRSGRHPI